MVTVNIGSYGTPPATLELISHLSLVPIPHTNLSNQPHNSTLSGNPRLSILMRSYGRGKGSISEVLGRSPLMLKQTCHARMVLILSRTFRTREWSESICIETVHVSRLIRSLSTCCNGSQEKSNSSARSHSTPYISGGSK
jgi:hypothetical protein